MERIEKVNSKKYIPKRVYISESAQAYPRTQKIFARLQKLNPDIQIENITTNTPARPDLKDRALYNFLKETIVLCTRSAPYIEVFASPGKISENLGIVGKIASHCPLQCTFCYLDISGRGTPWNRVYVDLEEFYEQAVKERLVYRMTLTLWSAISFHRKNPLNKVPENFKSICDNEIRKLVLQKRTDVTNDKEAITHMKKNLGQFFKTMRISVTEEELSKIKKAIPGYYKKNKEYPLWINISEYSDVIGLDHITNIMEELIQLVHEDPEFRIKMRTKAANITNLLKHDGHDRVQITFGLNTNFVIKKYEKGTASLDDRFKSINALIAKGDYRIQIAIEPIIKYDGYEEDYKQLIRRVKKEIDLSNVSKIKIGTVRYKTQLKSFIEKTHPKSDLISIKQELVEPHDGDNRWRYSEAERLKIYQIIKNELGNVGKNKLELAAESPELWDKLGLNKDDIHNDTVYQYR